MQIVIVWIKKYIFHIKSPYAKVLGCDYEWDYLQKVKSDNFKKQLCQEAKNMCDHDCEHCAWHIEEVKADADSD